MSWTTTIQLRMLAVHVTADSTEMYWGQYARWDFRCYLRQQRQAGFSYVHGNTTYRQPAPLPRCTRTQAGACFPTIPPPSSIDGQTRTVPPVLVDGRPCSRSGGGLLGARQARKAPRLVVTTSPVRVHIAGRRLPLNLTRGQHPRSGGGQAESVLPGKRDKKKALSNPFC